MQQKKGPKYRHELKYVCTAAELALIQSRIHHLIPLDSHVGDTGMYNIRSLYFTTIDVTMKTKTGPTLVKSSESVFITEVQTRSVWNLRKKNVERP